MKEQQQMDLVFIRLVVLLYCERTPSKQLLKLIPIYFNRSTHIEVKFNIYCGHTGIRPLVSLKKTGKQSMNEMEHKLVSSQELAISRSEKNCEAHRWGRVRWKRR